MAEDTTTPTDDTKSTDQKKDDDPNKGHLTQEQIDELLNRARSQEKDKLYPQIESLTGTVRQLQDQVRAANEEKARIEAEAARRAEEERQAGLSESAKLAESLAKLEEKLAQEAAERTKLETKLEQQRATEELARYRQKAIKAAGVEDLSDLIFGTTKEEVDNAVANAKARLEELETKIKEKVGQATKDNMPGPSNPDTAPQEAQELQKSIDNMDIDTKRYMKDRAYKAEIDAKLKVAKDELASMYSRYGG